MSTINWQDFRARFERDYVPHIKKTSADNLRASLNLLEKQANPSSPAAVTASVLASFSTHLKRKGRKHSTVNQHVSRLRRLIKWGSSLGFCQEIATFVQPGQRKSNNDSPDRIVTEAEFQKMLHWASAYDPVNPAPVRFFLEGLWLSGLRVGEACALTWNKSDIYVDVGEDVMLRIGEKANKNNSNCRLPIAPDFAAFLLRVPPDERKGKVFKIARNRNVALKIVNDCAKAADVKVAEHPQVRYPGPHDFRRAFASRWALKVHAAVLKALMRHGSIQTTMKHYVQVNPEDVAKQLRGLR